MFKRKISYVLILLLGVGVLTACTNKYDISNDKKMLTPEDSYSINEKNTQSNESNYKGEIELNGRLTLWELEVSEKSDLEIVYDVKNNSGNVRLAVTDNKKYVRTIFKLKPNQNGQGSMKMELKPGNYFIKIVGDKSDFKANIIDLNYSKNMMKTTHVDSIFSDTNKDD